MTKNKNQLPLEAAKDTPEPPESALATVAPAPPAQAALSPIQIIQQVIANPDFDVEKLGQMMELQDRWEKKEAAKSWGQALARFQAECPPVGKDKDAGSGNFQYRYAGYEDVMRVISPVLANCGLTISFSSEPVGEAKIKITCYITHETHTESREFTCPVPSQMKVNDTQKMGAALSYAKRYALVAALNIVVSGEDSDMAPPRERPPADPSAPNAPSRAERKEAGACESSEYASLVAAYKAKFPDVDATAFRQFCEKKAQKNLKSPGDWDMETISKCTEALK